VLVEEVEGEIVSVVEVTQDGRSSSTDFYVITIEI
jgi:hypothetical protein